MSKDLNKWMGIGRLGKDPELKYTASGNPIANFSIACGDDYKDKQSGQKVEKTEWVNISAFGNLAEIIGKYLHKGSKVYIEGKFTTRKWQDKQGNDRYSTDINASEMQFLDSRPDAAQSGGGAPNNMQTLQQQNNGQVGQNQGAHNQRSQERPHNASAPQQMPPQSAPDGMADWEDIPFS